MANLGIAFSVRTFPPGSVRRLRHCPRAFAQPTPRGIVVSQHQLLPLDSTICDLERLQSKATPLAAATHTEQATHRQTPSCTPSRGANLSLTPHSGCAAA